MARGYIKPLSPSCMGDEARNHFISPRKTLDIQRGSSSSFREVCVGVEQLKEQLCNLGTPEQERDRQE